MLKFNIPITGIIENMSFFKCDAGKKYFIFGENKVESLAKEFNTNIIAKLPVLRDPEKDNKNEFDELAKKFI